MKPSENLYRLVSSHLFFQSEPGACVGGSRTCAGVLFYSFIREEENVFIPLISTMETDPRVPVSWTLRYKQEFSTSCRYTLDWEH